MMIKYIGFINIVSIIIELLRLLCSCSALANYTKQLDVRRPITSAIATPMDQDKLVLITLAIR